MTLPDDQTLRCLPALIWLIRVSLSTSIAATALAPVRAMKAVLPSLLNPMFAPPSPIFTRLFDCPYINLTRRSVRKGELVDEIAGRRLPVDIGFYIGQLRYTLQYP